MNFFYAILGHPLFSIRECQLSALSYNQRMTDGAKEQGPTIKNVIKMRPSVPRVLTLQETPPA
jgi:hypothetical protein